MVSPFDSNWTSDSFVTAAQLNRVTIGNGTTAERLAVLDTDWENNRLFFDITDNNIYLRVGVNNDGTVEWRGLISSSTFGSGADGALNLTSTTDSSTIPSIGSHSDNGAVRTFVLTSGTKQFTDITIGTNVILTVLDSQRSSLILASGSIEITGTISVDGRGGDVGTGAIGGSGGQATGSGNDWCKSDKSADCVNFRL
uniref:Uncharacterized protein n=1 Tax=Nitrosopumivirus cobalaminus TaxID=3158414 RepID=A0AAU7N478_9VIRU